MAAERCPTCQGRFWHVARATWVRRRETVGGVCQTCGRDYNRIDGDPALVTADAPWGEHPALPPRLRVVRDCDHDHVIADQARRIADLEGDVRTWQEVARRHHDIAEQLRLAVEDHERHCGHTLPAGCTHWTTEAEA